jgi:integrase
MAIMTECPYCHRKQAVKNRNCTSCKNDLVKAKRGGRVRYWIHYRTPTGKQRWEYAGMSIEEARAGEGKRKAQKVENPGILEKVPADRMTFNELAAWYLDLSQVKKLASLRRIKSALANFNNVFGDRIVSSLKPLDLEDYQDKREEAGKAAGTIDQEVVIAKTMITKAFDNDLVDGRTIKAFRTVRRKLRKGANARRRTLTIEEYLKLVAVAPDHLKAFLTMAFNTGMRTGELRALKWSHIDREKWVIRLPAEIPKERRAKVIPMNHHVRRVLAGLPRVIHHDFVLTYRHESILTPGRIERSFISACGKAQIPYGQKTPNGVTFHDIRRTVKTNMLNAGVDQVHRDIILGHSLHGMDVHYMAPSIEDLHRAMDRYTLWMDTQFADVSQNVNK